MFKIVPHQPPDCFHCHCQLSDWSMSRNQQSTMYAIVMMAQVPSYIHVCLHVCMCRVCVPSLPPPHSTSPIAPPPKHTSPSYNAIVCPGATAFCASTNSTCTPPPPLFLTTQSTSSERYRMRHWHRIRYRSHSNTAIARSGASSSLSSFPFSTPSLPPHTGLAPATHENDGHTAPFLYSAGCSEPRHTIT